MNNLTVNYSKGQMKIQQMAFVIVALVIFFAMVGIIYVIFSLSSIKQTAQELKDNEARELSIKIASSPELAFTSESDCSSCLDLEKALMLKDLNNYKEFWNLGYLKIEKVFPEEQDEECTRFNFPRCKKITIIDSDSVNAKSAFVALARWDAESGKYKYELGRIYTSAKKIE